VHPVPTTLREPRQQHYRSRDPPDSSLSTLPWRPDGSLAVRHIHSRRQEGSGVEAAGKFSWFSFNQSLPPYLIHVLTYTITSTHSLSPTPTKTRRRHPSVSTRTPRATPTPTHTKTLLGDPTATRKRRLVSFSGCGVPTVYQAGETLGAP
jgi:hypothetical protein